MPAVTRNYIIVENLHFHDTPGQYVSGMIIMTRLAALRIEHGANHCIIRNNEFIKTGQGIMSAGEHTLITRNYLDGPSYALWRTSKSSWGPMGIHLNIGNQEVSYNTIKNFGTKDSPWGSDGGAIEIDCGRYHKKNIYIHHNYSEEMLDSLNPVGTTIGRDIGKKSITGEYHSMCATMDNHGCSCWHHAMASISITTR